MNKKTIITICVAVLVIAAGVAAFLVYSNSDYSVYSSAFKKTFGLDSMELDTSVTAKVDGTTTTSTGNFTLTGKSSTPNFVNVMTIGGQTITQFCDGKYIYTDDGRTKSKVQMGASQQPQQRQEKDGGSFTYEAYVSEFSSLLDANKIKELNSLEPVAEKYVDKITSTNSGSVRQLEVTLLPAAVDELVAKFLSENLSNQSMSPTVAAKKVVYTVMVSNGYITEIAFNLLLDVTAPNEASAKEVIVDFTLTPVNPGQAVNLTLPSTGGF